MSTSYIIQARVRPHPIIRNPRPSHWFALTRPLAKPEADVRIAALRQGSRDEELPYCYRLKHVKIGD